MTSPWIYFKGRRLVSLVSLHCVLMPYYFDLLQQTYNQVAVENLDKKPRSSRRMTGLEK